MIIYLFYNILLDIKATPHIERRRFSTNIACIFFVVLHEDSENMIVSPCVFAHLTRNLTMQFTHYHNTVLRSISLVIFLNNTIQGQGCEVLALDKGCNDIDRKRVKRLRIAVDAFGGDNAPEAVVNGCVRAANEMDIQIVLVGKKKEIQTVLEGCSYPRERITIRNATEVITNEDSPVNAIRTKKDSSLVVGLNMIRNGEADAIVSAGNTGAYLAGAFRILGRIKGIKRPALATYMPTISGGNIVLDVGANTDCKAENLVQFAMMGSLYAENVLKIKQPKVGMVNIGAEEGKGNDLAKEAFRLLAKSNTNFIGNIEARRIPYGDADVVVCDGFVGNVVLKLTEGVGQSMYHMLKEIFLKNAVTKLAALVLKPHMKEFKKKIDYSEYGGAPLLGIDACVIKAHGSSNAKAFYNAIKSAVAFHSTGVNDKIKQQLIKEEAERLEC